MSIEVAGRTTTSKAPWMTNLFLLFIVVPQPAAI
jgi:hypothetical protein